MSPIDRVVPPAPAPVRPFHFPQVDRDRWSNGCTLYRANYSAVPLASALLVLDAGAAREPAEQAGIARLTARTIDTGTSRRTAEQLSWDLESLGAHFSADTGWDSTMLLLTAPADRMKAAVEILAGIASDARFPDAEVERFRTEQIGEILQNRSEPRMLATELISRFIYGAGSTYGRSVLGDTETVGRLTLGDVRAFHAARGAPQTSALILVGAVDDSLADAAQSSFAAWRNEPSKAPPLALPPTASGTSVHVVHRPGSVQSEIRIGHPGIPRVDPDYFPLVIMNALLGGAFTSRLNMNLRERQGWTYGVRSAFTPRRGPGPFVIGTAVATDVTARAVREILGEVERLQTDGATEDEVANMRDYLSGVLALDVQTTQQLAGKLAELFLYDLPTDYFARYGEAIAAVQCADVDRVARQHIHRERMTLVIVGDAKHVEPELAALNLGPVQVHEADV